MIFPAGYLAAGIGTTKSSFVELATGSSASGIGYRRVPIALPALSDSTFANSAAFRIGPASAAWAPITQLGIYEAQGAPTPLLFWQLLAPVQVSGGSNLEIRPGSIQITFPDLARSDGAAAKLWLAGTPVGTTKDGAAVLTGLSIAVSGSTSNFPQYETIVANGPNTTSNTFYTDSGPISVLDDTAIFKSASPLSMTLGAATDGKSLCVYNVGTITATLALTLGGLATNYQLPPGFFDILFWSAAASTWASMNLAGSGE